MSRLGSDFQLKDPVVAQFFAGDIENPSRTISFYRAAISGGMIECAGHPEIRVFEIDAIDCEGLASVATEADEIPNRPWNHLAVAALGGTNKLTTISKGSPRRKQRQDCTDDKDGPALQSS